MTRHFHHRATVKMFKSLWCRNSIKSHAEKAYWWNFDCVAFCRTHAFSSLTSLLAHIKINGIWWPNKLADRNSRIDIQEVDIIDLLGRDPVNPVPELFNKKIFKTKWSWSQARVVPLVLNCVAKLSKIKPKALVIYELTEFALYSIEKELRLNSDDYPDFRFMFDQVKLNGIVMIQIQIRKHVLVYCNLLQ